ncbi:hypothetical protein QBC33DRAFT_510375 [Phialemonium atrogriseum]|uniref:Uncharacterized protein n=1 Tax=Phialemonium atrogriseum TaxID=1093897 RepID=A0AAJ0C994_9PEZI|nr:uncharacterized protein QBC33DRAFT_510375 [Phialemonium atrogriseum]KAK1772520.1 hypothetical protein QBC33DRAFT_510375 [Phialemonium atrogriseum]
MSKFLKLGAPLDATGLPVHATSVSNLIQPSPHELPSSQERPSLQEQFYVRNRLHLRARFKFRSRIDQDEFWAALFGTIGAITTIQLDVAFLAPLVIVALCSFLARYTGLRQKAWMGKIGKRVGLTANVIGTIPISVLRNPEKPPLSGGCSRLPMREGLSRREVRYRRVG